MKARPKISGPNSARLSIGLRSEGLERDNFVDFGLSVGSSSPRAPQLLSAPADSSPLGVSPKPQQSAQKAFFGGCFHDFGATGKGGDGEGLSGELCVPAGLLGGPKTRNPSQFPPLSPLTPPA